MSSPKILLIEPPAVSKFGNQRIWGGNGSNKSDFHKPPHDLMMISGYLKKEGYDNDLLDANVSKKSIEDVKNIIKEKRPDVVMYSTSTCTIYKDHLVAKVAKEVNPNIVTVVNGTHVMALPQEGFDLCPELDASIYSAEWEQASLSVVKNLSNLKEAKGIYYRNGGSAAVKTDDLRPLPKMDDLGFASHDKLEKQLYDDPTAKRRPKTMVMGQKSCVNACSFCCQPAFFGAPVVQKRSIEHIIEELKWVKRLGFREVMFNDATMTGDWRWATKLYEAMIQHNIDLAWNCTTRADRLNPELVKLMKKAGCHTAAIGMESVDEEVLKNINKHTDPQKIKDAISFTRKAGIDTILYCVIGFPGETKKSIAKTINFVKTLDTTFITLGIAVPAPGTDFYKFVEENNYLHHKDWSKYDPMQKPVFSYPELSSDDIEYYSKYGLREFYLRPSYIIKRLASIRSFSEASTYATNFVGFMRRYVVAR